jgi:hypothetical protein
MLYETLTLQKQTYRFNNIITNDTYDIELYPDDTNLTVLNKLSSKLKILTDEICAYVNHYNLIGFSYDNINIKQIFNNNRIDLSNYLDENFVDKIGNKINVYKNNLMNELFENNFNIDKNIIYYFTLNDLLKLTTDVNNQFIYSVLYKYFPNIKKDYIGENYKNKQNTDLRKKHAEKINKLISTNNSLLNILDENINETLQEKRFVNKLFNFKCPNPENIINIIKLFSDFELTSKRFYTKLILEDYNNSFFKLYKPELKLRLSDDKSILDKDICNKLLNDFSDNVSLPYDFAYMPPSIQPRNCIIFKTYLKKHNLFYSFILFMNGSYDFIINNYNNIDINDDILIEIKNDINKLINDINRYRIYTINKIPRLSDYNDKINFINTKLVYEMDNFSDDEGNFIYEKKNLLKYLSNFYTHIRIVKEKMDSNREEIIMKYKRVNNYENIDTIQSIISALHDPDTDVPVEEFIEIISQNTGISIDDATKEHKKWSEKQEKNDFKKKSLKTSETGAEIIMSKYLDSYIDFEIYNVQSRNELNRIIHFIKVFMKLYERFIKKELTKPLRKLFIEDISDKKVEQLQEEQQLFTFTESEEEDLEQEESEEKEPEELFIIDSSDSSSEKLPDKSSQKSPSPQVSSSSKSPSPQVSSSSKSSSPQVSSSSKSPSPQVSSSSKSPSPQVSSSSDKPDNNGDDSSDSVSMSLSDLEGGGRKINEGKDSYNFLNNLKNYDSKLFSSQNGINYSAKCTTNQGIKMPIPLDDDELDRCKKYDILKTVEINGKKLTQKEINNYMSSTNKLEDLKQKLDEESIEYSTEFPSFLNTISQYKIGDKTYNINYICPKYWDVSKRVAIHPRDIYDRIDDIIPPKFKGYTEKSIISNEGDHFKDISNSNIKNTMINFLKLFEVYNLIKGKLNPANIKRLEGGLEESMKIAKSDKTNNNFKNAIKYIKEHTSDHSVIDEYNDKINKIYSKKENKLLSLEWGKTLNDTMIKLIPKRYYDLLHSQIVKYIQPRFMDDESVDGYSVPCCFTYKSDYKIGVKKIAKLDKKNIRLAELTPSNINKFAHIHPKLQTLFGFNKDFHDNQSSLGGFIKFGVEQGPNALINVLSNIKYKNNNSKTFKNELLEKLNDVNSLLTFMKCGDGNIVQLFKSSTYQISDIYYFINYIHERDTKKQLQKININNDVYKYIKSYFKRFISDIRDDKEKSTFDKYKYVNIFKDLIYKSKDIKFIYDLIISKNNFIEYLKSNETKDYKYILPLISEINKNHIYILFENNDDIINIRLPLNTLDVYNDECIYHFIYKEGDLYEPIYYFNDYKQMKNENIECDIKYNMHTDSRINEYIKNILDGIKFKIRDIYRDKYIDINIFQLDDLIKQLNKTDDKPDKSKDKPDKSKDKPDRLLVDSYCKISHIITKNNCIYPVIPSRIIDGYELIYSFDKKPTFKQYLEYIKQSNVIKKKFKIKGFILNDKNNIINIVFKNNSYIPIQEEKYDKKNKYMRFPVLGSKDLFLIDKDLQNFTKESDERYLYNTDNDYINYITNLTIQNIIYYIKNNYKSYNYFTDKPSKYTQDNEYVFKLIPKIIDNKIINTVETDNDFIDYFYEPNKFKGLVKNIYSPVKGQDLSKLNIHKSLLNELYLIINNSIKINIDKQNELYNFINEFINEIIIELPDEDYDKYKKDTDISICFESNDKCLYPCFTDIKDKKCKLYVKKSDIYDTDKSLINKIIYKFIDLLLIHKNIDKISSILQDNININDLYKTAKNNEIFFNYIQYQNKYINELFKSESSYIRNINFYDRENTYLNQSLKSKPIKSIIKGVPNIIKKLFMYSNVLTYIDDNNLDFKSLEYSFSEIKKEEITSDKLKENICELLDKFNKQSPTNLKSIKSHYSLYDKNFKLNTIEEIKENINNPKYKINPFDLEILSQKYSDIGFLLITSKYSNQDPSKLKHNIIFKYNNNSKLINNSTNFILLYHFLNEDNEYDLSNIVIKKNEDEDDEEYQSYLPLGELYKIPLIKKIMDKDYHDIIKS